MKDQIFDGTVYLSCITTYRIKRLMMMKIMMMLPSIGEVIAINEY